MNEKAGTLENKHWLKTGPTEETLVAQNLQDLRGYIITTHQCCQISKSFIA